MKSIRRGSNVEDEETTYITKRFFKIIRRISVFPKRGESKRYNRNRKGNNICPKYGKLGHFIKECPLHKVEYKEYIKMLEKEKRRRIGSLRGITVELLLTE